MASYTSQISDKPDIEKVLVTFEHVEIMNLFEERNHRIEVYRSVSDVLVYTPDITWSQNCPGCDTLHIWQGMGDFFVLRRCDRHGNAHVDSYRCACRQQVKPPFRVDTRKIKGPINARGWFIHEGVKPSTCGGDRIKLGTYDLPVSKSASILNLTSFGKIHVVQFDTK